MITINEISDCSDIVCNPYENYFHPRQNPRYWGLSPSYTLLNIYLKINAKTWISCTARLYKRFSARILVIRGMPIIQAETEIGKSNDLALAVA